jgi:hypothetical protein
MILALQAENKLIEPFVFLGVNENWNSGIWRRGSQVS